LPFGRVGEPDEAAFLAADDLQLREPAPGSRAGVHTGVTAWWHFTATEFLIL
jgi:hypothetical protein